MAGRMEELNQLVELQALDTEVARLVALTRDIPAAIESRTGELAASKHAVETLKAKAKDAAKKRASLEGDLKVAQDGRTRLLNTLNSIKTNREYTAALAEIEAGKAKESAIEDLILAQLEVCERDEREVSAAEKKLRNDEVRVKEQTEDLRKELARVQGQLAERQADRGRMATGIASDLLSRYERTGLGGAAVVPVNDNVCGGCFRRLPPQMGLQVRLGEDIQFCQFCGRILYPGETPADDAAEGLSG